MNRSSTSSGAPPIPGAFLRVIAIGVQGFMNRSPKRTAESLVGETPNRVAPISASLSSGMGGRVFSFNARFYETRQPYHAFEPVILSYELADEHFPAHWSLFYSDPEELRAYGLDKSTTPDDLDQRDVENVVSRLYTSPYAVERVSDAAIETAKKIILQQTGLR